MKNTKLIALLLSAFGGIAMSNSASAASPVLLNYSSYSQVYGWLTFQPNSPYLPPNYTVSAQITSAYEQGNGIATASWAMPAGEITSDLIYNAATSSGQYSYSYQGQAQVLGNQLKASVSASSNDFYGGNPSSTNVQGVAYASYNDQWYIAPNSKHAAGTYGAIVVTAKLDGSFPAQASGAPWNSASAYLNSSTSFTDSSGVNYNSNFQVSADPNGASVSGGNWTPGDWTTQNSITVSKKLLFQYGTVFNFQMYLYANAYTNGGADFFNTAKITDVLLPFESVLETGSLQSGVAGVTFGAVRNSTSLSDPNTNWDFGNGGGPIVPVPEPESYAMLLAGLGLVGFMAKRRKRA